MKKSLTPLEQIGSLITTTAEADSFINKLDQLFESMYRTEAGLDKKMSEIFDIEKKQAIDTLFASKAVTAKDRVGIQRVLNDLKQYVKAMPHVKITLSFEPSTKLIKKVSSWLLFNLSYPVLIELANDRSIIAGMVIEYQGKYLDYSLRKILDTVWNDMEAERIQALEQIKQQMNQPSQMVH